MLASQASKYDKVRQGKSEFTTTEARDMKLIKQNVLCRHRVSLPISNFLTWP
ncbi:MAG: hypothetical protein IPO65_16740 [Saprospiraceae bacterium]|nr:hypothetical protein [Saprospiraceae bacterium]